MARQAGEMARDNAVMGYVVLGSEHPQGSPAMTPEHQLAADRCKAAQEELEGAREAVAREA